MFSLSHALMRNWTLKELLNTSDWEYIHWDYFVTTMQDNSVIEYSSFVCLLYQPNSSTLEFLQGFYNMAPLHTLVPGFYFLWWTLKTIMLPVFLQGVEFVVCHCVNLPTWGSFLLTYLGFVQAETFCISSSNRLVPWEFRQAAQIRVWPLTSG